MIQQAITNIVSGQHLTFDESSSVMDEIMTGSATPSQFGAFVTGLRLKGETSEEIAGMASVMQDKALSVEAESAIVDTCGTGGDGAQTINISTMAAFVTVGAGLKVAKHGNRAITSSCGSADVLEAAGVKIDLGPEGVTQCINEVGMGFMFAPIFHPAMRFAGPLRREIGIRTVFNILGPLTNPARAKNQVLGIADPSLGLKMAEVLKRLGCLHALIVHGNDGLDEISISSPSQIWELKSGEIYEYTIAPEDFGMQQASSNEIRGGAAEENVEVMHKVLSGEHGPRRDVVLLNAAAALKAGNQADSLAEGLIIARESIDSGRASNKLQALIDLSQQLT